MKSNVRGIRGQLAELFDAGLWPDGASVCDRALYAAGWIAFGYYLKAFLFAADSTYPVGDFLRGSVKDFMSTHAFRLMTWIAAFSLALVVLMPGSRVARGACRQAAGTAANILLVIVGIGVASWAGTGPHAVITWLGVAVILLVGVAIAGAFSLVEHWAESDAFSAKLSQFDFRLRLAVVAGFTLFVSLLNTAFPTKAP